MTEFFSVKKICDGFFSFKKFCDGFLTEISQKIMTEIFSVIKKSVMKKVFPSQNCDGVLSLFRHNFVTDL